MQVWQAAYPAVACTRRASAVKPALGRKGKSQALPGFYEGRMRTVPPPDHGDLPERQVDLLSDQAMARGSPV
jgi:hypothetical protein